MATESVRLNSTATFEVNATTSTTLSLYVEGPSGDATADSGPAKIYLPIQKNSGDTKDYYINSRSDLPLIFNTEDSTHVALAPMRINTNSEARYLYAAVKDTTDSNKFKVIKRYSATAFSGNTTNNDVTFAIAPYDICRVMLTDCAYLAPGSLNEIEKSFIVYFFLSNQSSYPDFEAIEVTTAPFNTGIYYQFFMSNKTYSSSDLTIAITGVKAGDKRVIISYAATGAISSSAAKHVRIYNHNGSPSAAKDLPVGSYSTGAFTDKTYDYTQSGEITVTGLENQTTYNFSVAFVDKYKFASTLSDTATGTPKTIEELLKKQACFLLTAGFGEEHYVINYFRDFRDHFLVKHYLGRVFISTYYDLAPKYAYVIYKSEGLRAIVRYFGYSLYFIFINFKWIALVSLCVSLLGAYLLILKKRSSIKLSQ